jgi:thiamine biosynthesis lipoprotein
MTISAASIGARLTLRTACGLCAVSAVLSSGCQPQPIATVQVIAGQTMGTTYSVKFLPYEGMPDLSSISDDVSSELDRVNQQMSTYRESSELSRFNQSATTDWFEVSPQTAAVVALALEVCESSDGAFDVTIGPLVNLWGFGPDKRPVKVPSQQQIDRLLAATGSSNLEVRLDPPALRKLKPELQVDLSAIAKGHGVDRVAAVLDRLGAEAYFIEIGGEIRTRGVRMDGSPWKVGIEQPVENKRDIQRVIGLSDRALATSGNYRNFYELDGKRFSHTINPTSGWPVEDAIVSASAIADDCALADAIATSMMSSGFAKGLDTAERNNWSVLLVRKTAGGYQSASSTSFNRMFPEEAPSDDRVFSENTINDTEMELRP